MMTPRSAPEARFPEFDTLRQARTWDDVTREVVRARVEDVPSIVFFCPREERVARALLSCLLAQCADPPVPVLELIDARLANGDGDGYRHEEMPDDGTAWRLSLAGLDADASERFGSDFPGLTSARRHLIVQSVQDCKGIWRGLPADRLFGLWMRYACSAFYSHPSAWNEIGFGGPAYPRGYKNIGLGRREPWEVAEIDADDPIPWATRVEAARRRHEQPDDTTFGRS